MAQVANPVLINPFGVLYNPQAILRVLERALWRPAYVSEDLHFDQGRYFSYEAHSKLSDTTSAKAIKKLNQASEELKLFVAQKPVVVITLGTAWVYQHLESNEVVANCHKVPARNFRKKCLSAMRAQEILMKCIDNLRNVSPESKFIFTLSPVRHLKDGMSENAQSKAILKTALYRVCSEVVNCEYFPAYEIMMDDLRDYRFYKSDMLHPNPIAIQYIWDFFKETFFPESDKTSIREVEQLRKAIQHRPFDEHSSAHAKFLTTQEQNFRRLKTEFPDANWSEFEVFFEK